MLMQSLQPIAELCARYSAASIPTCLYEQDDMLTDDLEHYMLAGRFAVQTILRAMIVADKTEVASVLDLPSGAGRVTRHLQALFPDANLFVSDAIGDKAAYAASHFGATILPVCPAFSDRPQRGFDLIFCGSLVTHLDESACRAALSWLVDAANPNGLVIITTSGRRMLHRGRRVADDAEWQPLYDRIVGSGFNFYQLETVAGLPYGSTHLTPSWLMRWIEQRDDVMLSHFQEAGWRSNQDVAVLIKQSARPAGQDSARKDQRAVGCAA